MNQPIAGTAAAGRRRPAMTTGMISTAVAPMTLTSWIAPNTRERSW